MSILDDAIREHLELKRAHGADDHELKRLEDEAFGPPQRPDEIDPFAEAPTEFLTAPEEIAADLPEIDDEVARGSRRPDITDLQEPPPPGGSFFDAEAPAPDAAPPAPPEDELAPAPDAPPPSPADAADVTLPPPPGATPADLASPAPDPIPSADDYALSPAAPPATEDHPAGDHEIVPDSGPSTEERHAIADQPTQMFDVQAHVDAEATASPTEQASPTDEELVDAAQDEPHAAPPATEQPGAPFAPPAETPEQPPLDIRGPDAELAGHPPTEATPEEESAEYDFFNEQRLADELDQALEAPIANLPEYEDAAPAGEDAPEGGGIFDFESHTAYEEDPSEEVLRRADAREAEPPSEEAPLDSTVEQSLPPAPEPPSEETPSAAAEPPSEEDDYAFDPDTGHEDVLEDTPRFLEDAPEDDDLWFEQKPPKDFDLD